MRNGYGKSLFPGNEDGTCYICGYVGDTARHEIIHGSRRTYAKRFGLWISVCPRCHTLIHQGDNGDYLYLKSEAQLRFMLDCKVYDVDEFIEMWGKSYI